MKVLFATSIKSWGGGEEWMLSACRGMKERGHAVTLAARPGSAIAARAIRQGISCMEVPFRHDLDADSFWRVYRFCAKEHPDLLCVNMDRVLRVAGSAARAAGVRCVIHCAESPQGTANTARADNRTNRAGWHRMPDSLPCLNAELIRRSWGAHGAAVQTS